MENFIYKITPSKLNGTVNVSGAKNSALRLLAASILTDRDVTLENNPNELLDVKIHVEMLEALGKNISIEADRILIKDESFNNELVWNKRSIRNTVLIAGALFARSGYASVPLPGGCQLGDRKIDIHLDIFEKFGAKINFETGETNDTLMLTKETELVGQDIHLPIRSTGATENSILIGSLAKGTTRIFNPHVRPEVLDLLDLVSKMGAKVEVFGQDYIQITGIGGQSTPITPIVHEVVPDNVEAITWLMMAIVNKSKMEIKNFPYAHLVVPMQFLLEGNSGISFDEASQTLSVDGKNATSFEIATGPYPGINSDMHPIFAAYGTFAMSNSVVTELRFFDRFQYLEEMAKLGANIVQDKNTITISGNIKVKSETVRATDLRGGMAVLMLLNEGTDTATITEAFQIERGYNNFVTKFNALGGKLEKVFPESTKEINVTKEALVA
ncbi:UDP-N-acetylglucosamine 1-carboxyvinyltransferase [Flammeovirga agarivorans]|uniref:UDP-N-acetylglucosamine 1-carboxyvinyltransferase n=1 Tax=Flammeovirga agarivorans TaxID=2726742 RepID=A0A7X8SPH6_9BACT|nr:UDP-N-acetylglucosamine 1-carboxyvinyltransferase [Flammeovirga agarivorans]NLR93938.1 UDP-N-acetylglucosamine 1-carboxyvinyltransferase [Flammeovirga agarivorans]